MAKKVWCTLALQLGEYLKKLAVFFFVLFFFFFFQFLADLYECTGRAIALPPGFGASVGMNKMLSLMLKFLCDGQGAVR